MLKIIDQLRLSAVKRWTIVPTSIGQSVAEHSYNVAVIARAISLELGAKAEDVQKMMAAAIDHDMGEIFTGDIPATIKHTMRLMGMNPKLIEDSVLPDSHRPALTPAQVIILKAADKIDAIWFLANHGSGQHASEALGWCMNDFRSFVDSIDEQFDELRQAIETVQARTLYMPVTV